MTSHRMPPARIYTSTPREYDEIEYMYALSLPSWGLLALKQVPSSEAFLKSATCLVLATASMTRSTSRRLSSCSSLPLPILLEMAHWSIITSTALMRGSRLSARRAFESSTVVWRRPSPDWRLWLFWIGRRCLLIFPSIFGSFSIRYMKHDASDRRSFMKSRWRTSRRGLMLARSSGCIIASSPPERNTYWFCVLGDCLAELFQWESSSPAQTAVLVPNEQARMPLSHMAGDGPRSLDGCTMLLFSLVLIPALQESLISVALDSLHTPTSLSPTTSGPQERISSPTEMGMRFCEWLLF